jgi:thimet oligopeptidase
MRIPSRLLRQALCLFLPVALLAAKPADLAPFQAQAAKANSVLLLPTYPVTPDEVKTLAAKAIETAEAALTALAAQDLAKLTFANTFQAYDAISGQGSNAFAVVSTVAESALSKEVRDTANEMNVKLQEWSVGLDYRDDIYRVLQAFAATRPALDAQEQRLVDYALRGYRRAGLNLPAAERNKVEQPAQEALAGLEQQFSRNINEARAPIDFTAEELAGVPASFLRAPA